MIKFESVTKSYPTGTIALDNVDLFIDKGEFVFLIGPSGSGKTTFLKLLIRELIPTSGDVLVSDISLAKLKSNKVPLLRKKVGVVFQDLKMLTDRTIFENVVLPLEMSGVEDKKAKEKVDDILSQVGIIEHKEKFPVQLSGGELQRAAIARALVFEPNILLADEPTGNLDSMTSWEILKILQNINQQGTTVVMATHNADIVSNLDKRTITLDTGKLVDDKKPKKINKEKEKEEK